MDVKVTDLDRLLMAPPMTIEGLDQVKLQSEELAGVWTVGANVLLGHAVLALPQKAKVPRTPLRRFPPQSRLPIPSDIELSR
jgi:hypothetical protein